MLVPAIPLIARHGLHVFMGGTAARGCMARSILAI